MFETKQFKIKQLGLKQMDKKECDKKIGRVIHRLDKMLYRNLSASSRMAGMDELTIVHGWILHYLYDNREKNVYQRDIEKEFGVGRSSVTTTIQIMERNGYLRREAVESDARLKKVTLTEKGFESQEKMEILVERLNEKTLEGIGEKEFEVFLEVIEKLEENLERQKKEREERKEEPDDSDFIKRSKGI